MAFLSVATAMLVIVSFSTSLAHALEYPGKMGLDQHAYIQVQKIYYPGFTVAGLSEPFAVVVGCIATYLSHDARNFPFLAAASALMIASHAAYWIMTHPVNGFWLADENLGRAAKSFFSAGSRKAGGSDTTGWRVLRDRWEHSHILRSILSGAATISILCAMVL